MAEEEKPPVTALRWLDAWLVAVAALGGLSVWIFHDNPEVYQRAKRVAVLAPIVIGGAVALVFYQEARWFRGNRRRAVIVLCKMAVVCVSTGAIVLPLNVYADRAVAFMFAVPAVVPGSVVLGLGVVFFAFRTRARLLYGVTEIVVGVLIGVQRFGHWEDASISHLKAVDLATFFSVLGAGIYLIVRGLDNCQHGLRPENVRDPVARLACRLMLRAQATSPRAKQAVPAPADGTAGAVVDGK